MDARREWRRIWARIVLGMLLAGAVIALAMLILGPHAAQPASGGEERHDATNITTPIEALFTYEAGGPGDIAVEGVYTQCDLYGHRVYASRHPERPIVITDPSCDRYRSVPK